MNSFRKIKKSFSFNLKKIVFTWKKTVVKYGLKDVFSDFNALINFFSLFIDLSQTPNFFYYLSNEAWEQSIIDLSLKYIQNKNKL